LKHSSYIRRFTAVLFLLLFSFCITPKRFLHDMLANHRDMQSAHCLPVEQLTASGFHCHIDDLVVMAPFLPGIQTGNPVIFSSTSARFSEPLSSIYFLYCSHQDGRGPPAVFFS
jgi:hypothetical protein